MKLYECVMLGSTTLGNCLLTEYPTLRSIVESQCKIPCQNLKGKVVVHGRRTKREMQCAYNPACDRRVTASIQLRCLITPCEIGLRVVIHWVKEGL